MKYLIFLLILGLLSNAIEQPQLNQAVIVSLSRYWLNYRHGVSGMLIYNTLRRMGYADDQLLFFLPDDHACHPRNPFPGEYRQNTDMPNEYKDVIVDYKGSDVSIDKFMRSMLGRDKKGTPDSLRVVRGERTFVYLIGHGGEGFMKFQNRDEITSWDIEYLFNEMEIMKRYKELMFVVDTCQAQSLSSRITAKNIITVGSSVTNQSSYSGYVSPVIGAITTDLFDQHQDVFFKQYLYPNSTATVLDYLHYFTFNKLKCDHSWRGDLFNRPLNETLLTDFLESAPKQTRISLDSFPWCDDIF
ncbi:GPI-anchor transamidase [Entamoeba marina]